MRGGLEDSARIRVRGGVCMYVTVRRRQHTRVHARTVPRRHARALGMAQTTPRRVAASTGTPPRPSVAYRYAGGLRVWVGYARAFERRAGRWAHWRVNPLLVRCLLFVVFVVSALLCGRVSLNWGSGAGDFGGAGLVSCSSHVHTGGTPRSYAPPTTLSYS